jgi:hypothetical protein
LDLEPVGQVSTETVCEYKKTSFHILFRKLSTVITPFYATVEKYATEQMLFSKSYGITARLKNVNFLLCFFGGLCSRVLS